MPRMPQVTGQELVCKISVTIPIHTGSDLGRGLAVRILKDAGFSIEDFLRLR